MSLLNELLEIDKQRVKREKVVLRTVWDRLCNRVKLSMKAKSQVCMYTIPEIIPGYPLTNVPKTMDYILNKLNKEGFYATKIDPFTVYISWNAELIRNLDRQTSQKQPDKKVRFERNTDISNTDLIDILIKEKAKEKI